MEIAPWELFIRSTALHAFVQAHEPWLWPLLQSLRVLAQSARACDYWTASPPNSALASTRSGASNPSVNQL